jgi:L-phenylalanine/L-methionine N-acetyltransferase
MSAKPTPAGSATDNLNASTPATQAAAPVFGSALMRGKHGLAFRIRRPMPSDAADVCEYMQHPNVYSNLLQLPYPSLQMWEERLKNQPPEAFQLAAVAQTEQGPKVVALAGMFPDRGGLRRKHVLHLGMSVAVEFQGQGIGDALMTELLQYADNWAQCLRLELEVFSDNPRAIALYEKHGFVIEGTKRFDAMRDGQYVNSHIMGRLHPKAAAMTSVFAAP